jgi:hypothetical protein
MDIIYNRDVSELVHLLKGYKRSVRLPEELNETPAGHHDPLVLVGLVLGQVTQQVLRHGQRGPGTHLPAHQQKYLEKEGCQGPEY